MSRRREGGKEGVLRGCCSLTWVMKEVRTPGRVSIREKRESRRLDRVVRTRSWGGGERGEGKGRGGRGERGKGVRRLWARGSREWW